MSGVVVSNSFENGTVGESYSIDQQRAEWDYLSGGSRTEDIASISDEVSIDGSQSLRVDYSSEDRVQIASRFALPDSDEYFASYAVYFPEDFEFNGVSRSGGKLPGLGADEVPTGGDDVTGDNGFSARYMWRLDGQAELYLYHMDKEGQFGDSINFFYEDGSYAFFERGEWNTITQRIKTNDAGEANGEIDVWLNGDLVVDLDGVRLSNNDQPIDVFYLSSFYGGGSREWLPENDTTAYFDNIVISTEAEDVGLTSDDIRTPEENTYHGDGSIVRELIPYTRSFETDIGIVEISHDRQWGTGYTASVSLTPEQMTEGWVIQIETPGVIDKLWDGEIVSYIDGVYTLRSTDTPDLEAGETGTIRIKGEGNASRINVVGGTQEQTADPVQDDVVVTDPTPPAEEEPVDQPIPDPVPEDVVTEQPEEEAPADDPAPEDSDAGDPVDVPVATTAVYDLTVRSEWDSGFVADLSFTPQAEVNGWTVQFTFAGAIEDIWNADIISQEGNIYTITGKSYNSQLNAGEAASITIKGVGDVSTLSFATDDAGQVVTDPVQGDDTPPVTEEPVDQAPMDDPDPIEETPMEDTPVDADPMPDDTADQAPEGDTGAAYGVTIEKEWASGFIAELDFTPEAAVNGWTAQITFAGEIESIWRADIIERDGDVYTIKGMSYNSDLDAGEMVSIRLKGNGDSSALEFGPTAVQANFAVQADEFEWLDASSDEAGMMQISDDGISNVAPSGLGENANGRNDDARLQDADTSDLNTPIMPSDADLIF